MEAKTIPAFFKESEAAAFCHSNTTEKIAIRQYKMRAPLTICESSNMPKVSPPLCCQHHFKIICFNWVLEAILPGKEHEGDGFGPVGDGLVELALLVEEAAQVVEDVPELGV